MKRLFMSAVLTVCFTAPTFSQICDDFTAEPWPSDATFGPGDTVGFSQELTQPIIVGPASSVDFYGVEDVPGMYVIDYSVLFEFDGTNQTARFERYGWTGDGTDEGFSVNGSDTIYFDEAFPVTIEGITVSIEESPADFGFWDIHYVRFTGDLSTVNLIGVEFGVTELCVEPVADLPEGCDDFTDTDAYPTDNYMAPDTVGYTQEGEYPIVLEGEWLGDDFGASVNYFVDGIYVVGGAIRFEADGSDQTITLESYGWIGPGTEEGFTVNGSDTVYLDDSFPLTIDGITVDLDDSAPAYESWDTYYLIFSGEIDQIVLGGVEYGIKNFCVEANSSDASIFDETVQHLKIYPNPAQNHILLESTEAIETIQIYDLSGKVVYSDETNSQALIELNISMLEKGAYIIQTTSFSGYTTTTQFMKN